MKFKDRIFAPGPTPVPEESRLDLARSNPYHRSPEFSRVIRKIVDRFQGLLNLDWPVLPVSASGTGGMQMLVDNLVDADETALVIESGKFGERWTRLLNDRGVTVNRLQVPWGQAVSPEDVESVLEDNPDTAVVFGTLTETSTLVKHPIGPIGKRLQSGSDSLFVVDAISGLGADPFRPDEWNVDAFVAGSQKGLMTPPGVVLVSVSDPAIEKSRTVKNRGTYFDLPLAVDRLSDANQTPWTPAMNLLRSLLGSLKILEDEGMDSLLQRHQRLGEACRRSVRSLGLESFAERPSNAGTAVKLPEDLNADSVRELIRREYGTYFPGGQKHLAGDIVRIGHLGHRDHLDLLAAIGALELGLAEVGFLQETGPGVTTAQQTFVERTGN